MMRPRAKIKRTDSEIEKMREERFALREVYDPKAEKAVRGASLLSKSRNLGIVALAGSNTQDFIEGFVHSISRATKFQEDERKRIRQVLVMKAEGTVQGASLPPKSVKSVLRDIKTLQEAYQSKGVIAITGFDFAEESSIGSLEIHEKIFEIMEKNGSARSKPDVPAVILVGPGNFTHLPSHPNFHRYPNGAEQPLGALALVRQALDADGNLATAAGINEYQATPAEAFSALSKQWNT